MRENYLVEQTVGRILRGAFKIYFAHFGRLFLIYLLPVVPVAVIQSEALAWGNLTFVALALLLQVIVTLVASAAITVAVSDVCLGNVPTLKRSYARIRGRVLLTLLGTNMLQLLGIAVGLLLIVIPGLVLMVWFMLSPSVVVLERKGGVAALRRSKQLGDGSHWRNVGILILLTIIMSVIGGVIGGVIGAVSALFHGLEHWLLTLITIVQQGLAVPVSLIAMVLVYYDRRVRKEGYDTRALAEDLAR